jgi:hypothetical protein
MTILINIIFVVAILHFVYESILAPSWRLRLRYRLFALRDELRDIKTTSGDALDDRHYRYLQASINIQLANLYRYDFATFVSAEFKYRTNPRFKKLVDSRSDLLDDCNIPEAKSIRNRSLKSVAAAIAINSVPLCIFLLPIVVLTRELPKIIRIPIKKIASLSEPSFERVDPAVSASVG